jgi:hypothetical protein
MSKEGRVSYRVRFPGAVNSKFTTEMTFTQPSNISAIPTYRVMDSDGRIVDPSREPPDVSDEEILTWYKNMLTGTSTIFFTGFSGNHHTEWVVTRANRAVNIMDLIMFEAQRQGRLSFYMVDIFSYSAYPQISLLFNNRLLGLRWRRRYCCWLCLGAATCRYSLRPVSRSRRFPATRIHAEAIHEPVIC